VLDRLPHVLPDTLPVLQHAAKVKVSYAISLIGGLPAVAVRRHRVGLAVRTVENEHDHRHWHLDMAIRSITSAEC
jgi:hypothetical protein